MRWISFDYIYFRLYQFYFKWDGRLAATATLGVAGTQALILMNCILIPLRLIYSRPEIAPYSKTLAYFGVGIFALLTFYNFRKYRNGSRVLRKTWQHEPALLRCLCELEKTIPKPLGKSYVVDPVTVGEQLRNRRLELRLK